jgi:hypothetical protein
MPKGVINFQEIPVTNDNASVGNHVVIASQYATHAFFRKYAGKTGMLAHWVSVSFSVCFAFRFFAA